MSRRLLAVLTATLLLLLGTTSVAHAAPGDVTITLPGGAQGEDRTPLVEGTADPTYPVHVLVNGVEVAGNVPVVNGTWSFQLVDPLEQGQQADITAEVRDNSDNLIGSSYVSYYVLPPVGVATIVSPNTGATVGRTPQVVATITGPVQDAQLLVDGQPNGNYLGVTEDGTHEFFTDTLPGGPHTLQVAVLDGFDREFTSAAVAVTVDATPPPPATIESPAAGSVITDRTPTFSGRNLPGGLVTLRFSRSYEIICSTTTRPDGTWSCQPEGQGAQFFGSFEGKRQPIMVLVTNTDAVGNENSSEAIELVVDYRTTRPTPTNPPASDPSPDPASPLPAAADAPELANTGPSTLPGLATALLLIALGLTSGAVSRRLPTRRLGA